MSIMTQQPQQPFNPPPNPFYARSGGGPAGGRFSAAPAAAMDVVDHPEDRQRRRKIEEAMLRNLRLEGLSRFVSAMTQLRPAWASEDPALRTQLEEQLQSVAFGASGSTPLTISSVAQEQGLPLQHEQLVKVGAIVARLYREKHHADPPKKFAHGGGDPERRVNAYVEADRELITGALNQFFAAERVD